MIIKTYQEASRSCNVTLVVEDRARALKVVDEHIRRKINKRGNWLEDWTKRVSEGGAGRKPDGESSFVIVV